MITVKFLKHAFPDGKMHGYSSTWRPDQEDRDPITEAQKLMELHGGEAEHKKHNMSFYLWEQYYDGERPGKTLGGESTVELGDYLGSSEKQKLDFNFL